MTDSEGNHVSRLYPTLQYRLKIRRNPSFYVSILVVPCILLSCLTLVLFWLPPESPAKMMLGMNIFVAFFVLLLLLAESTPSAVKNFPLIGALYCLNMTMITLSTFLACIVINLYFRGDRRGPVPPQLRRIFIDGLGNLLLVRQNIPLPSEHQILKCVSNLSNDKTPDLTSGVADGLYNNRNDNDHEHDDWQEEVEDDTADDWRRNYQARSKRAASKLSPRRHPKSMKHSYWTGSQLRGDPAASSSSYATSAATTPHNRTTASHTLPLDPSDITSPLVTPKSRSEIEKDVFEVRRYIRLFVERQKGSEQRNMIAMQWRTVALVLDRLFFVLYLLAIVIAIIILMPRRNETLTPFEFR